MGMAVGGLAVAAFYSPAHATLINNITTPIVVGDKSFSGFSCKTTGTEGDACGSIDVTGFINADGHPNLEFQGGLAANGPGSVLDVLIKYNVHVTDPTQQIKQISLDFNPGAGGTTNLNDITVAVTETVRSGNTIVGNISVNLTGSDLQDPPFEVFDIPLSSTFTDLSVTKDIQINIKSTAPQAANGNISFVNQDFEQTGTSVPEPTVLALLGAGFVSLGAVIRRRRAA